MRAIADGRVVVEAVQVQWGEREAMLWALCRAEDDMINALAPRDCTLSGISIVQARAERIRKAALREFALIVWGREVEFL